MSKSFCSFYRIPPPQAPASAVISPVHPGFLAPPPFPLPARASGPFRAPATPPGPAAGPLQIRARAIVHAAVVGWSLGGCRFDVALLRPGRLGGPWPEIEAGWGLGRGLGWGGALGWSFAWRRCSLAAGRSCRTVNGVAMASPCGWGSGNSSSGLVGRESGRG